MIIQMNIIHLAESLHEGYYHCGRRRQASDRQSTLNYPTQANAERITIAEFQRSAAQIICPVALLGLRHGSYMPLSALGKLERGQFYDSVLLGRIGDVNAPVYGETGNLSQLVIRVRPDGTHPVRTKRETLRLLPVRLPKAIFALH